MPELTSPPALLPLYVKAALSAPMHRGGGTLPSSVYTLADQKVDPEHLAAFQRVCGYRVTDVLPPTYLQVLSLPLSIALMSERTFPFPVIGLVHVANSITLARAVRADEQVSFRVHGAGLRPHPAGRQFDLLVEATVDGELVWSGRSTYLRRGKPPRRPSGEKKQPAPASPEGAVSVVQVPGDIGRRYAGVSGDSNLIHMYNLTARAFGFRSAIAHGMWLKARTLAALEGRLPDAYTVDVAFKLPVLLPTTVSIGATRQDGGWTLGVHDARSGKPHLAGTVTVPAGAAEPAPERPVKQAPATRTAATAKKAPVATRATATKKAAPEKKAAPAAKAPAAKAPAAKAPAAKKATPRKAAAKKAPPAG